MINLPINQALPHHLESEMALLGSLLLEPRLIDECAMIIKTPRAFYQELNATLYNAILGLWAEHRECDLVMLTNQLQSEGLLDAVGGTDFLTKLVQEVPSPTNAMFYAKTVAEHYRKREMISELCNLAARLYRHEDSNEIADELGALLANVGTSDGDLRTRLVDAMQQVRADLETGKQHVRKTGLKAFDQYFGGVPACGVVTILGIPGSGKTSLAMCIAREIATNRSDGADCGVLLFSYEMSAHAIALNAASALGQCNFSAISRGLGTYGEREQRKMDAAVHLAARMHFEIVDACVTPNEIYRRTAVGVRNGFRVIVVDYVQNLPSDDPKADDVRRIESACRMMQRIARDHGVLVILVSQMDKASTHSKEPPKASDGKGSGAIREVSDMMIGVFRPALWETPTDFESGEGCSDWTERKQYVELEVLKNKQGPLGTACVRFLPEWTAFEDREDASIRN